MQTNHSALLIDLASLETFVAAVDSGNLLEPVAVGRYELLLREGKLCDQQLFEVLSNIICFDGFIVDKRALYSFQGARKMREVLRSTALDKHVTELEFAEGEYKSAIAKVGDLRRVLLDNAPKKMKKESRQHLEDILGYEETRWVDDATLKDMYDRYYFLERPDFSFDLPRNFAITGMSVERLFVYLEVAKGADVPVMLARGKYGALRQVGVRVGRAAARIAKREAESLSAGTCTGLEHIQMTLQKAALPRVKLSGPLLPGHIIRVAKARGCSIWDAVVHIRNDEPAADFRKYIWESRKAFDPIYAGDHLKGMELDQRLAEIGARIRKARSATGAFISKGTLTINSSNVPYIGDLLKLIGLRKVKVPLPLPRLLPSYEVFMARWFQ